MCSESFGPSWQRVPPDYSGTKADSLGKAQSSPQISYLAKEEYKDQDTCLFGPAFVEKLLKNEKWIKPLLRCLRVQEQEVRTRAQSRGNRHLRIVSRFYTGVLLGTMATSSDARSSYISGR